MFARRVQAESATRSSAVPKQEQSESTRFFQPKLSINAPGDKHEQEADNVADQVMRMKEGDAPIVQRMPLTPVRDVQRKCAECENEEKEQVQRKENASSNGAGNTAPSIVSSVLSSGSGRQLDSGTRQFMESRFGQDFGQVRIHTDSRAAESASAIQARAYTSGRDVVFGEGEYQPSSESGRRLLAHELAHVGQQADKIYCDPTAERVWFERNPEPRISEDGNRLILWNFPISSSRVQEGHRAGLARFLFRNNLYFLAGTAPVEVTGYASQSGGLEQNIGLSRNRAFSTGQIIRNIQPLADIQYNGAGVLNSADPEEMARNRKVEIVLPPHRRRQIPGRDSMWRRAQQILEERVGANVGGGVDLMWTPTSTAINRMMPTIPLFGYDIQAGRDVPRVINRVRPASQHMPRPHSDTVRILGNMLDQTYRLNSTLNDQLMGSTIDYFLEYGRRAKSFRGERLTRLEVATSQGGGSMIADDLRAYNHAEQVYFIGDPTCIWRYLS